MNTPPTPVMWPAGSEAATGAERAMAASASAPSPTSHIARVVIAVLLCNARNRSSAGPGVSPDSRKRGASWRKQAARNAGNCKPTALEGWDEHGHYGFSHPDARRRIFDTIAGYFGP